MRHAVLRWPGLALVLVVLIASFSQAQAAKHAAQGPNPDESAIHDYILTIDKVNSYAVLSKKLQAAAGSDPVMAAEMKKVEEADVYMVERAALIEKSPHAAAFLKTNGMSAREFVLIPMTAVTAAIAASAQDAKGKPPAFVNPANIQFVRDHRAELKKLENDKASNPKDSDERDSEEKDSNEKEKN
jgi:hypothetical protein